MRRAFASLAIVLLLTVGVALAASGGDSSRSAPRPASHPAAQSAPIVLPPDLTAVIEAHDRLIAIVGWADAVNANDLIVAVLAAQQAEMRERSSSATSVVEIPQQMLHSSGACGGATNGADQFIQRESGGDPSAMNPSGAWGCFQIMPGTWASSCGDLGDEHAASAATQAACASRLPLSAWAE